MSSATDSQGREGQTPSTTSPSRWHRIAKRFLRQEHVAVAAGLVVVGLVALALLAPVVLGTGTDQDLANVLADPLSDNHLLGTDELGRDVLARLGSAAGIAFIAGLIAVSVAIIVGVPLGVVSGYFGGLADGLVSRVVDGFISVPPLILAIGIVGVLGQGLVNAMVAVGVVLAPTFARLTRSSVRSVRVTGYVAAARSIGVPDIAIIYRHVLPNILGPIIVQASLSMGIAVIAEASLSFLGLGVQSPQSSWGIMMARAFPHLERQPWLIFWPGIAITIFALAWNLFGDGLRDAMGRED